MEDLQFYAILITPISLFYAWFFFKKLSKKKQNLPPSPPRLPVVGNLHQLGKLPNQSLWELSKKYGPVMLLHFGSKPTFVVSSPEAVREVLKTHDFILSDKPGFSSLKKIFYDLKDMIHLPYGDQWRKLRAIFVQELLSIARVNSFTTIREEEMILLLKRLRKLCLSGSPINLSSTFITFTNGLICRAAFGEKPSDSRKWQEFLAKTDEIVGLLLNFKIGEFVPWLAWLNDLNGYNASLDRYAVERDELLDAFLEHHLNIDQGDHKRNENFVDILLDIYKGKVPGFSIDLTSVKGVIVDVFGAGTETSATSLIWTMTELIRHPTVMKKLQDEVRKAMKGKQHISDDDLQEMPYLKAVIKESLRLHPPLAIYFRTAKGYVNLMGYDVQPNTNILINVWALGRDPSSWNEPEKFMPERFIDSSVDFKGFDFCFVPFGAGRRVCPGLAFATISIEHTVANLVHKFDWALPDGARGEDLNVDEKPGLATGRKDPLVVVATKCYF